MSGSTVHWTRAGVTAGILTTALSTLLIFAGSGTALAASPAWTVVASPNATLSGGQLQSVSCASADDCTAVGSYLTTAGITATLAEQWNGSAWQKQPTPDPPGDTTPAVAPELSGVSCPVSTFCAAVGQYQQQFASASLAETWNGSKWTLQPVPVPANSDSPVLTQVSCTSATFCEAVGSYFDESDGNTDSLAAAWNGTSWTLQTTPVLTTVAGFNAVSCTSPRDCEAWGGGNAGNPGPEIAEQWNGSSWQQQPVPANAVAVTSVSCVSAGYCEAVGTGAAYGFDGSQWTAQTLPSALSSAGLTGVSCALRAHCEAVGAGNVAAALTGNKWSAQSAPYPAGSAFASLTAVSCASARTCEAAGDYQIQVTANDPKALAEAWDGSSWAVQHAAAPAGATDNSLSGVSCASASFCAAVGTHANSTGGEDNLAELWTGTSWQITPTPDIASTNGVAYNVLNSVSCVSASFCQAVGTGPDGPAAALWNGTAWTVQTIPGPDIEPQAVSCATTDFCLSANGYGDLDSWNGSAWSADSNVTGFTYVSAIDCLSATFCEVVGEGPAGENAAAWNGTSWTAQATPGPASNSFNSVSCTAPDACEAAGQQLGSGSQTAPLAEAWDGSAWTVQSVPAPASPEGSTFTAVSCTSATSCTAVGQYQSPTVPNFGQFQTLAEVWDGTSWTIAATADPSATGQNLFETVSCGATATCTAAGQYQDAGGIPATLIETGS